LQEQQQVLKEVQETLAALRKSDKAHRV